MDGIDAKRLARLLYGEKESWEIFVSRSTPLIRSVIYKTMSTYGAVDPHEAEDALQSVYIRLLKDDFRLLRSFDPRKASLSTWLGVISRSTTIDLLRRRKSHYSLDENLTVSEDIPQSREDRIDLPKDLLSGRQELILRLLFDKEMEPHEVAELLGVEVQTVRSAKHKAIEKLRTFYKDHP